MPRKTSLLTVIRDTVQAEVRSAIQSLLGGMIDTKSKAKNGRRRRRKAGGKWRPGGPGRPPKAVVENAARKTKGRTRRRGRAKGSKKK